MILHIKKSFCNCPFAEGNRKVCKHKIAIYFSAFPEKAEEYYKSLKSYDEPEFDDDYFDEDDEFDGDFREIVCDILNHRISKMTKSEAQSAVKKNSEEKARLKSRTLNQRIMKTAIMLTNSEKSKNRKSVQRKSVLRSVK